MKGVHKKHKKAIQFYKWGYWWSGAEASLVWFNRTEPATAPLQWTVRGKRLLDYAPPVLIDIDNNDIGYLKSYTLGVLVSSLNCSLVERWCLHVPVTVLCTSLNEMASGGDGSRRLGGESSGKSDVCKYSDKSADRKKAELRWDPVTLAGPSALGSGPFT